MPNGLGNIKNFFSNFGDNVSDWADTLDMTASEKEVADEVGGKSDYLNEKAGALIPVIGGAALGLVGYNVGGDKWGTLGKVVLGITGIAVGAAAAKGSYEFVTKSVNRANVEARLEGKDGAELVDIGGAMKHNLLVAGNDGYEETIIQEGAKRDAAAENDSEPDV